MLRKIHSNRDPRNTLYSEIRREFGAWFALADKCFSRILGNYPRFFFLLMILLMALSAGLSFTFFRHPDQPPLVRKTEVSPVSAGFDRILRASEQLRETIVLKQLVDSLTSKKVLSKQDSTALDTALDRLRILSKPFK